MRVHWHRRDLRLGDNRGLSEPEGGPILPVFVLDPAIVSKASPPRMKFLLSALRSLRSEYRARGGDVLLREGDPATVLPSIVDEFDVSHVSWNIDYSGLARRRDRRVRDALDPIGVATTELHDAVLHPPGEITTADGEYYKVFSYFGDKWLDRPADEPVESPDRSSLAGGFGHSIPSLESIGFDEPEADIPAAGMDVARTLLDRFCEERIAAYDTQREYPAKAGTSKLSPHLRFGTIGIREVVERVNDALDAAATSDAEAAISTYLEQLAWREFYTEMLWNNPETVRENFRDFENPIEWRDDPAGLRAWKAGETGYPLVDAGMRQLRNEAWMHNRVRMVVASFLTKDLMIDWRAGYDWFRTKLVDHDPGNDVGGWQWAASTGTDAQPYFRIFNPSSQCERHDPDGEYVRRYVSELDHVPTEIIHAWPSLDAETRDDHAAAYCAPIVDHAKRRTQALEMFERATGAN